MERGEVARRDVDSGAVRRDGHCARRGRRSSSRSRADSKATIKEIWSLQPRFEQRAGQRPFRLLEHPRYRAGWDFLDLRCKSGELEGERADLADWWDRFANAGHDERLAMLKPDEGPKKKRRSRGRGRKRREETSGGLPPPADMDAE